MACSGTALLFASVMRAICPASLKFLDFITLTTLDKEGNLWVTQLLTVSRDTEINVRFSWN
jgi:hypothetical protein